MQFLFAPIWGLVSDRVGRRPILLLGLAGSVIFYALLGYALTQIESAPRGALVLLFLSRIGAGVMGATISTAQAVIADCTPPEHRKHGMAMIGAAFGIGFTFGPLLGAGCLAFFPHHRELIGYLPAGISAGALLLGFLRLRETRDFTGAPATRKGWFRRNDWATVSTLPGVLLMVAIFFNATMGFAAFESTIALFLRDAFGFPERDSFTIFAAIGLVLLLTQGILYRRLAKRWSEVRLMRVGIVLMALGVFALGYISLTAARGERTGHWVLLALGVIAAVMGFAFLTPSAQALISRFTPANRQGEVLGVNQAASSLARIIGPVAGLTLYKLTSDHVFVYVLGVVQLLILLPLLRGVPRADTT
jgi:MFS family permease